jgi:hypothetical protein
MYVHTLPDLRPSADILKLCSEVVIADPKTRMWAMKHWCREHELSLVWAELVDTRGVSPEYDSVAAFYFEHGQDATLFRLRYS